MDDTRRSRLRLAGIVIVSVTGWGRYLRAIRHTPHLNGLSGPVVDQSAPGRAKHITGSKSGATSRPSCHMTISVYEGLSELHPRG